MIGTGGIFFYYLNHVSYLPETIFCIDLKLLIFSSNMIGTGGNFFLLSKSCQLFA